MHHLQREALRTQAGLHAHRTDVAAAEHVHRRLRARAVLAATPFTVEELLHVRQEGDELVVVPLVELADIAGVLVDLLLGEDRLERHVGLRVSSW